MFTPNVHKDITSKDVFWGVKVINFIDTNIEIIGHFYILKAATCNYVIFSHIYIYTQKQVWQVLYNFMQVSILDNVIKSTVIQIFRLKS